MLLVLRDRYDAIHNRAALSVNNIRVASRLYHARTATPSFLHSELNGSLVTNRLANPEIPIATVLIISTSSSRLHHHPSSSSKALYHEVRRWSQQQGIREVDKAVNGAKEHITRGMLSTPTMHCHGDPYRRGLSRVNAPDYG
ncbi:hypothetical protein PG999_007944 [Apiospora kogelbergensis]|uniref:Uncharacterized protein n=1 Tax=Apiospora kogelbergensis TaxID=1337665 RepID=A0AAW0QMK7_9PEZI